MRSKEKMPRDGSPQSRRSHTEKRRGAQRQTMTSNQEKTRRKQKHLACDPNVKEQEPTAKGNPSIVIKSVRKTHLAPKGDPIPKEYKQDQQTKPSFRSSGRTQPTLDPDKGDLIAKARKNTTDGDRQRTKRRRRNKTEPRHRRGERDWKQTTEHLTPGKPSPDE